jgi:hypothetical protein
MSFVFLIEKAGKVPSAGVCYIEGRIETGTVKGGETATVEGLSDRSLSIKSVALVNAAPSSLDRITRSVEEPVFPLDDLCGRRLISNE